MLVYAKETLADTAPEAGPLLHAHWEAIALNKYFIKLNPDWNRYEELERLGVLQVFTARHEGRLVGYFVMLVVPHLHYMDHLFAHNDIIYIDPEHRKGFAAMKLIKFAEEELKKMGVSVMMVNIKRHKPFDALLARMGYNHVENIYAKRLRAE